MKNKLPKWLKRMVCTLSILLLIGCTTLLSINQYMKHTMQTRIISVEDAALLQDVDCILVLGCGVRNHRPSPMLSDRLETGLFLYDQKPEIKLLMSGDHGQKYYDEVNVMKDYAIAAGIPSEDIFMDHAGFSTYESMYRARDIFCAKKIIVVSQNYHLYRAIYVANALGLDAYGVSADSHTYPGQTYRDVREVLARNKDFFYCLYAPKPSCLGEAIPVNGNGNITNDKHLE